MSSATPHSSPISGRGLLIAVAGVGPRTGVTTTALALARSWPGPELAVLVEADPAGGQLAGATGADPYRGLASLARAEDAGARAELTEHVQLLAGGVAVLAAPAGRSPARTAWTTAMLTGQDTVWKDSGVTVVADCGAVEPGSVSAAILDRADACLIVVAADRTDPAHAADRIRVLTAHSSRRRGLVLIDSGLGSGADDGFVSALALPVLARLPHDRRAASALVRGTRWLVRRNRLLPAARAIAATVTTQLRSPATAPSPAAAPDSPHRPPPARPRARLFGRRPAPAPTVYRIDPVPSAPRTPAPAARRRPPDAPTPAVPDPARPDPAAVRHPVRPAPAAPSDAASAGQGVEHTGTSSAPQASVPSPIPASPRPVVPGDLASPSLPEPTAGPILTVQIFGATRIFRRDPAPGAQGPGAEVTGRLQPRSRELLTVLALHPQGVARDALQEALWGEERLFRPGATLTNALGRLRTTVAAVVAEATDAAAAGLLAQDPLYCRLNPELVSVDYWEFTAAVATRRQATGDAAQAAACARIVELASLPLATDLAHSWVEPLREAARRQALNAMGWLAAHTTAPRGTLGMLETAAEADPYNERIWQEILRLHARLGEYDALERTYSLMTRKLAEIHEKPSHDTRQLLAQLRHTPR